MKVQVIIDLDLPEECGNLSFEQLVELIHEIQIRSAVQHYHQAIMQCCKVGRIGESDEDPDQRRIYDDHCRWVEVLKTETVTVVI